MHQFTHDDTQTYQAEEVIALIQQFYGKGKEKGRIEGRFTNYRWLVDSLESMSGRASDFSWDCNVVALDSVVNLLAEALRQSQSLPAGAVASEAIATTVLELIESARRWGWRQAGGGVGSEEKELETKAIAGRLAELVAALQADARENGEAAMPTHLPGWNYWRNTDTGKVTIMLTQDDLNTYVKLALATQPAQASEAGTGGAVVLDRGFRYENGVHTPTVLIGFNPNDWRARDLFASLFATSSQETASE